MPLRKKNYIVSFEEFLYSSSSQHSSCAQGYVLSLQEGIKLWHARGSSWHICSYALWI